MQQTRIGLMTRPIVPTLSRSARVHVAGFKTRCALSGGNLLWTEQHSRDLAGFTDELRQPLCRHLHPWPIHQQPVRAGFDVVVVGMTKQLIKLGIGQEIVQGRIAAEDKKFLHEARRKFMMRVFVRALADPVERMFRAHVQNWQRHRRPKSSVGGFGGRDLAGAEARELKDHRWAAAQCALKNVVRDGRRSVLQGGESADISSGKWGAAANVVQLEFDRGMLEGIAAATPEEMVDRQRDSDDGQRSNHDGSDV